MSDTPALFPDFTFTEGSKGPAVLFIQQLLHAGGYRAENKLIPDGEWGPVTTEALKEFQTHVEIGVSGHFDPETRAYLGSYFSAEEDLELDKIPGIPGNPGTYVPAPKDAEEPTD